MKHLLLSAVVGLAVWNLVPGARAGDAERFCVGGDLPVGTLYHERWQTIEPGGKPWSYVALQLPGQDEVVAPGFPSRDTYPGLATPDRPGLQSLLRAAAEWSLVPLPVYGPGVYPTPLPAITSFEISSNPGVITWQPGGQTGWITADGVNVVSLWEPATTWVPLGGPMTLAATVTPSFTLQTNGPGSADNFGYIDEADIALNTLSTTGGTPFWSFVEKNAALSTWFATSPGAPWADPVLGFADFDGVLTHEFGHFAGIEHSLVDGKAGPNASRMPTMFPMAQAVDFNHTPLTFPDPVGTPTVVTPAAGSVTWGRSARSLELDDIKAIAAAYPPPQGIGGTDPFTEFTGTISGHVEGRYQGNVIDYPGLHVMAYMKNKPNVVRTGTLTDEDGNYEIRGLPPGEYYVYCEEVDVRWSSTQDDFRRFFRNTDMPNYIWRFGGQYQGCIPLAYPFRREYWNDDSESIAANDDQCDRPQDAVAIPVEAGQEQPGIDLKAGTQGVFLAVSDKRIPGDLLVFSERGQVDDPDVTGFNPDGCLYFQVRKPWDYFPEFDVKIFLGYGLSVRQLPVAPTAMEDCNYTSPVELFEIDTSAGLPAIAGTFGAGSGTWTPSTCPWSDDWSDFPFRTLYAQAALYDPNTGQLAALSNTVTVLFRRPW